jgi:hypothetical protein
MLNEFVVGYEFPLFKNRPKRDGAVLEVSKEGSYLLPIFLSGMLPKEIESIKRGKIEFRIFEDNDTGFLLTLIRLGMNALTFEIVFDPTLYKDRKNDISLYTKSNILHIFGVESNNNILQCQRLISIPPELQAKWLNSWERMLSMGDCNKQYMNWIFSLYRFDLKTLWSYSTCVAKIPKKSS